MNDKIPSTTSSGRARTASTPLAEQAGSQGRPQAHLAPAAPALPSGSQRPPSSHEGRGEPTERQIEIGAVRSIVAVFREFEQATKSASLSMAQYRLLLFLRNGPRRAGEIAATSLVTKGTISLQLAGLRERGLIDVQSHETDRRVSRVVLTGQGRAEMDAFEATLLQCLQGLTGPADRPEVMRNLHRLYLVLGDTRETRLATV